MHLRTAAILGLALLAAGVSGAARLDPAGWTGRPLGEVLLEASDTIGRPIVFSSALVPATLRVADPPPPGEGRAVLDALLAAFDLALEEGPAGALLVVRRAAAVLAGRVVGPTGAPVAGATVAVAGGEDRVGTDDDGRFRLELPAGRPVRLAVSAAGYAPFVSAAVDVGRRGAAVEIALARDAVFVDEVEIAPTVRRLEVAASATARTLSERTLEVMPHLGGDLERALRVVPGVTGAETVATPLVRGGQPDGTLIVLDGVELLEPVHLAELQPLFSTLDTGVSERVEVLAGGFPVDLGDRLSGVVDVTTATPATTRTSVGLGTLQSRLEGAWRRPDGRLALFAAARGWYPNSLRRFVDLGGEEIDPVFWDLFAKVALRRWTAATLELGALAARDDVPFTAVEEDEEVALDLQSRSLHGWARHHLLLGERLDVSTSLFAATIDRTRLGSEADAEGARLEVADRRGVDRFGARQGWSLAASERLALRWGWEASRVEARYAYRRTLEPGEEEEEEETGDPLVVDLEPDGTMLAAWGAARAAVTDRLVVEAGLRLDRQGHTVQGQLSPRLALVYAPSARTTLRLGGGRYSQSHRLNELQVSDGEVAFAPAEHSNHVVASAEHRLPSGLRLRADAYAIRVENVRLRYENLYNPFELFPEASDDRVAVDPERSRLEGLELLASRAGGRLSWQASVVLARAEDRLDGAWVPRSWDQTWAFTGLVEWRPAPAWSAALVARSHTGWPVTPHELELAVDDGEPVVEVVRGARNADRYAPFHSVDARVARAWSGAFGRLEASLEVFNVLDRANPCCVDEVAAVARPDGSFTLEREVDAWPGRTPVASVTWSF